MWPADRVLADWCLPRLDDALESEAFAALRRAGAALAPEQAVAAARLVAARVLGEQRAAEIWRDTGAPDPSIAAPELALTLAAPPAGSGPPATDDGLSPGERDILGLIGERLSDAEIAARLGVALPAVEGQVASLFANLGVATRRDAAAAAARLAAGMDALAVDRLAAAAARAGLTPREQDVLAHLFAGRTDREIADALFISRRTASKHVEGILAKLGVGSRGAAVAEARRQGLVLERDRAR
jgi:DNA-binding CsgD family transcriptional regulator